MSRKDAAVNDEYDAFLDKNGALPARKPHPVASAIVGWWITLAVFGAAFAVAFDPPNFFAVYFLTALITMPVAIISAVVASRSPSIKVSSGARHLPRM